MAKGAKVSNLREHPHYKLAMAQGAIEAEATYERAFNGDDVRIDTSSWYPLTSDILDLLATQTAPESIAEIVEKVEAKGVKPHTASMSTSITREELDAKLEANVSEVKATAAGMQAEMASLRAENQIQFSEIKSLIQAQTSTLNTLGAKIDGVEKGLEGKIDGLKSSINMLQWVIGIAVAIGGIWVAYMQLRQAETPPPQVPPVVYMVPQPSTSTVPQQPKTK